MTSKTNKTLDQRASDRSIRRIKELVEQEMTQAEIVEILNNEGFTTIRRQVWTLTNLRQVLHRLRHQAKSWYALSSRRANFTVGAAA